MTEAPSQRAREVLKNLVYSLEFWHREAFVRMKDSKDWLADHVQRDNELCGQVTELLSTSPTPIGDEVKNALRVSAQAFRTLEEVAVAQHEHDKARNFIRLGDMCRAAIEAIGAPVEQEERSLSIIQHPPEGSLIDETEELKALHPDNQHPPEGLAE